MAKPKTAVILKNNAIGNSSVTFNGNSNVQSGGSVSSNNPILPRYPAGNIANPQRSSRARVSWGLNTTPTGKKADACRFIIDCGEPVAAEAIGLIDCNAKSGRARFYGTNTIELLTPYYGNQHGSAVTSADPDVITVELSLSEATESGLILDYPEDTDWQWANRAQLDYYSYIASSSYQVPSGSNYLAPGGLRRGSSSASSDKRNHQGRTYVHGASFDGELLRPHTVRFPENQTDRSGNTYGLMAGADDPNPIIQIGGIDPIAQGLEEGWQYNQLRGKENPDFVGQRGTGGIDPIAWNSTYKRLSSDSAYYQVNDSSKPVGWHSTGSGSADGSSSWVRDCGAAVGNAHVILTMGCKLIPNGDNCWWALASRGGSTSNYEGVFATNGQGASDKIRIYHWQPQSHPGEYYYWEVDDTYLNNWHVYSFIRKGSGTEELELLIDGVSMGTIDPGTWGGGSTASFSAINIYRVGHRQQNDAITAIDSATAVWGEIQSAYFGITDWGYGIAVPSDTAYLKLDAQAQANQAMYDLGIKDDNLKRRYWCVEFDELRGDMGIDVDYLELGGAWVGSRDDLNSLDSVAISSKKSAESSNESYSGALSIDSGRASRSLSFNVIGKSIKDASDFSDNLNASKNGLVVVDCYPSDPEARDAGAALGRLSANNLSMSSLNGSKLSLAVDEDRPFVSYSSRSYSGKAGWTNSNLGIIDSASQEVEIGSLFILDEMIQPGKRSHILISDPSNSYTQVVGPGAGATLTAGLLNSKYDSSSGLPKVTDWDFAIRAISINYQDGLTGWDATRATNYNFQMPWIKDGAEIAVQNIATGAMFAFARAMVIDFNDDSTITGQFGQGTSDPTVALTSPITNSGGPLYGARRFALYWSHGYSKHVPATSNEAGSFPASISFIDIP